jgi:hypothetical protein
LILNCVFHRIGSIRGLIFRLLVLKESRQGGFVLRIIGAAAIVTAVDNVKTCFAHSQCPLDAKSLARYNGCTLRIKDASTGSAMVLSTKRGESIPAKKAFFADVIRHPEFLAQNLLPHFFKFCADHARSALNHSGSWNAGLALVAI